MTGLKRVRRPAAADDKDDRPRDNNDADSDSDTNHHPGPSTKRRKLTAFDSDSAPANPSSVSAPVTAGTVSIKHTPYPNSTPPSRTGADLLSPLSDELLLRILSHLSLPHLLAVAPVSRRFYRLASDSQLWKALYYERFVLPRVMRIPGFRDGMSTGKEGAGRLRFHHAGRKMLWVDGRRKEQREDEEEEYRPVDWKRQYKIRYNWARGKCAVEELKLSGELAIDDEEEGRRMLVKVVEGLAVTADRVEGLRAWDLKTRSLIAQIEVVDGNERTAPSAIAVDDSEHHKGILDVALGFTDGSFGVWRLTTKDRKLALRYRHAKSSNGELIAMSFLYPYLLTATRAVLISLYTFEVPITVETGQECHPPRHTVMKGPTEEDTQLPAPYLLTSLDSHTSRPPLALSIRRAAGITIASVAYTFSTRRGWSIGIQDLHIQQVSKGLKSSPEITTTRLAFTTPVEASPYTTSSSSPRTHSSPSSSSATHSESEPGPLTLCYTHPYLLATLPDNTLVLHLCTSTATSLTLSDGIRLWGHTSGISDAEITARGKAVSVSTRGEEMRVWELEGRSLSGSKSVEVRPWQDSSDNGRRALAGEGLNAGDPARDWDERRNWVGFDDEMVIVLKERKGGRQSLMVYDFT
ncbi:uncharacterized protein CTHT_0011130 [Thermochaetoides thermophila DSM 1495]|uniref:F-box domain-containing protein n=1 Tax=Chaetomium thermophilum (strain DSM 1495 / CBS 144.50 / IMI 039719) TaxID=759272 RepID=G0S0T1_CHATD|nr:hypothetical protein CTHT_0011130 [Thermochaetoides thermophila DSM 1495]EGS22641.1 hypothetical protein CTHT_0011130 [Thermochaetoides thermophila DSM 1495]